MRGRRTTKTSVIMALVVVTVVSCLKRYIVSPQFASTGGSWESLPSGFTRVFAPGERAAMSIVMTADPGDLIGGFGESSVLLAASTSTVQDPLADQLFCVEVLRATISEQRVLLATTGIGTSRAALCLDSLLRAYGDETREIIFLGTSGGSPAKGGAIDSGDCTEERSASEKVGLGDVCVSSFATNWDCQRCVMRDAIDDTPLSACESVDCTLHDRWDLFGEFACSYFAETSLARELVRSSRDVLVEPSKEVMSVENVYWQKSSGLSSSWSSAANRQRPTIYGPGECAEATSTTYWNGAPFDELARTYVAELINEASAELGEEDLGKNKTRADVVAVSAMEGAGWMLVLRLSEVYMKFAHIPAANVRAVSDYDHDPLVRVDGAWYEDHDWLEGTEARRNATRAGYEYAIRTSSAVVLSLFEARWTNARS